MDPGSAPGLDGFNVAFYQSCWHIVGDDVCRGVRQFFQSSWLYPNMNSNFIVFIPKTPGAITQFRPIALANFFFKIIPKIIADRLASVASRIDQHAFIKGRKIADCVALVSEGVHFMDKKAHGGNVGFKLDVTKAFDTMSWDWILSVLGHFGFCETFVSWVKTILESARLSVLINGSPHGFFGCSRGVRQGDPLSPILFCIAEDFLSRGLAKLFSEKNLSTITTPRNCSAPSHVLFSDEIFIFFLQGRCKISK